PRTVAYGSDRLPLIDEMACEGDGARVHPQLVGVHDTTREDQRVVVRGTRAIEGDVDLDLIAPLRVVPCPHAPLLGRNDVRRGAGLLERPLRLQRLDLLDAFREQDRDLLAL